MPNRDKPFLQRDLFGGQGLVSVWDLLGSQAGSAFTAALWCELEPGASVGKHTQQEYDEIVVAIAGTGTAQVDDQVVILDAGQVVVLPRGATLALSNTGAELLVYLIIKAVARADQP